MTTNDSHLCSQCRSPINAKMKVCSTCAARLSTTAAKPDHTSQVAPSPLSVAPAVLLGRRIIGGIFLVLALLIGDIGGYLFNGFLCQPVRANDEPLTAPETTTLDEIPLVDPADLPVLPPPADEPLDVAGMGEEPLDVAGMGEHPDYMMPGGPIEYDDGSTETFEDNDTKDEAIGNAWTVPKDTHHQEAPHKSTQDYIDTGNRYARNQNYAMAVVEIEQAANMGHADSQRFMGEMYRDGKGVPQDYSKAHEWYEKAASNNNPSAMYALALFYWEGQGVDKDRQKARSLFLQAANLGDAEAQYNLGMIYKMGWGVEKDQRASFRWFEMAAKQNLAEALYVIGYDYEHGEGVEKDQDRALEHYRRAAELGEQRAIKRMDSY